MLVPARQPRNKARACRWLDSHAQSPAIQATQNMGFEGDSIAMHPRSVERKSASFVDVFHDPTDRICTVLGDSRDGNRINRMSSHRKHPRRSPSATKKMHYRSPASLILLSSVKGAMLKDAGCGDVQA
jgi:hypothetical protein